MASSMSSNIPSSNPYDHEILYHTCSTLVQQQLQDSADRREQRLARFQKKERTPLQAIERELERQTEWRQLRIEICQWEMDELKEQAGKEIEVEWFRREILSYERDIAIFVEQYQDAVARLYDSETAVESQVDVTTSQSSGDDSATLEADDTSNTTESITISDGQEIVSTSSSQDADDEMSEDEGPGPEEDGYYARGLRWVCIKGEWMRY